jgi:hypothetical protein
MKLLVAAVILILVHSLDGQDIYVNPREIVSIRKPQSDLLHSDVHCSIQTVDGKLINVIDECTDILRRINGPGA